MISAARPRTSTRRLRSSWRQCKLVALIVLISSSALRVSPSSSCFVAAAAAASYDKDHSIEGKARQIWGVIKAKYDDLPDHGKFATGAIIGYAGSRAAVRSAVGVVKVAGAAYVASEVLNAAGVLDNVPKPTPEQSLSIDKVKRRALRTAQSFRTTVRTKLSPENLERMVEKERMASFGVASGAFLGFLL